MYLPTLEVSSPTFFLPFFSFPLNHILGLVLVNPVSLIRFYKFSFHHSVSFLYELTQSRSLTSEVINRLLS